MCGGGGDNVNMNIPTHAKERELANRRESPPMCARVCVCVCVMMMMMSHNDENAHYHLYIHNIFIACDYLLTKSWRITQRKGQNSA